MPSKCAKMYGDQHVNKILLEITQMLYTAWHMSGLPDDWNPPLSKSGQKGYKCTHQNHPMSMWVRYSKSTYIFATKLGANLALEYKYRFGKDHACSEHILWLYANIPKTFQYKKSPKAYYGQYDIPQCMPPEYQQDDPVLAYAMYYKTKIFLKWTKRIQMNTIQMEDVIPGHLITKEKRHELHGEVAGGKESKNPENYQRAQIIIGTGKPCDKTNARINIRKNELHNNVPHPMKNDDGFDYTEDFDGKQVFDTKTVWVNLKSVVGTGGSQTRTLRDECYRFVCAQLDYLLKINSSICFFANIFDGDEAASKMRMFTYLLTLPEYAIVSRFIYVGDLKGYFDWLKLHVVN